MKENIKTAIVTGAAAGIGRSIALNLSREGYFVVVADLDQKGNEETLKLIVTDGGLGQAVAVDISQSDQVNSLIDSIIGERGGIDVLVNNAGICPSNSIEQITDAEWAKVISVNLTGYFYCCRAVIPHYKNKKKGVIVNISSLAGRSVSVMGGAHYTASKAGVIGLTRHLAKEVAPFGVRVNAVCPGAINTRMQTEKLTQEDILNKSLGIPLRRLGEPKDVAGAVLFLVSEKSSFMTGAIIDVNGGSLMI